MDVVLGEEGAEAAISLGLHLLDLYLGPMVHGDRANGGDMDTVVGISMPLWMLYSARKALRRSFPPVSIF